MDFGIRTDVVCLKFSKTYDKFHHGTKSQKILSMDSLDFFYISLLFTSGIVCSI